MYHDFEDFEDEHQHIRVEHYQNLDQNQYGDDCDLNDEKFYDLDVFSVDYAKALFHGLGDIAKYKGFNRVGETIPFEDYFDDQGNSVNFPQDNPHDLYHPNNQIVLDTSTMPEMPVDPQEFMEKVSAQLRANKVLISNDMPDLLEQMCRLFNFSIEPNQDLSRTIKNLVFPAQTGIGKSVSVQVYVSMLESHSSVIVVPKVEEAIKYCYYINQLSSNENYARCYYALTDKNKDDPMRVEAAQLQNHRCIVITHNMFRRVSGFDNTELFSHYQDNPRDFVSIDEKLSFFEQYQFGYKELDQLIQNVEKAIVESEQLKASKTSYDALKLLKQFQNFLLDKDDKILTGSNSIVIRDLLTEDLEGALQAIGEELQFSEYSSGMLKKLTNLKDKQATLEVVQGLKLATQARKRKVIGVPFMDVIRKLDEISVVDSYYCELLDDPKFDNCVKKKEDENQGSDQENSEGEHLAGCDDDMLFPSSEEIDAMMEQSRLDYDQGIECSEGLSLALKIIRVLLEVRTNELILSLEDLGANKNPMYKQNILNKIDEQITTLEYFALNHFLIYKTNFETTLLATENLTHKLGLSVVLDATAQINEYYQLANRFLGHVGFVTAPQIRQYQNLIIHKAKGFNQSRGALYKGKEANQINGIAKAYASYALNELDDDDKMLIICHKQFKPHLSKQIKDHRVEYTHWGNHIGRNDWSHCNKVMLVGWHYLNQIQYVSTINSSLESVLLTSRHLDDELIEKFEISQLADDIVQGLMRSQARIIATEDSDCKPTSFYLFYPDNEKSHAIVDLVESQFPKATMLDWSPSTADPAKKKPKRNKKADSIIELLIEKSVNHDNYLRNEVMTELGINKSTMNRIVKDDYFLQKLSENGFSLRNLDGKSQHFILK